MYIEREKKRQHGVRFFVDKYTYNISFFIIAAFLSEAGAAQAVSRSDTVRRDKARELEQLREAQARRKRKIKGGPRSRANVPQNLLRQPRQPRPIHSRPPRSAPTQKLPPNLALLPAANPG